MYNVLNMVYCAGFNSLTPITEKAEILPFTNSGKTPRQNPPATESHTPHGWSWKNYLSLLIWKPWTCLERGNCVKNCPIFSLLFGADPLGSRDKRMNAFSFNKFMLFWNFTSLKSYYRLPWIRASETALALEFSVFACLSFLCASVGFQKQCDSFHRKGHGVPIPTYSNIKWFCLTHFSGYFIYSPHIQLCMIPKSAEYLS